MRIVILIWMLAPLVAAAQSQTDSVLPLPHYVLSWGAARMDHDSVVALLPTFDAEETIITLCKLSQSLLVVEHDYEKAKHYASVALSLSSKSDYPHGIITARYLLAGYASIAEKDTIKSIRLLQQAERYFNQNIHWSMKYRIWFDIGTKFEKLNMVDSAICYFSKPLKYLDAEEAWLAHYGAYSWLIQHCKISQDYVNLSQYLDKQLNILITHPEFRLFQSPITELAIYENIIMDYAVTGQYKTAADVCRKILDSISVWKNPDALWDMFQAKFLGRIARVYHHWGRYDTALIYHDSALIMFNHLIVNHREQVLSNSIYPTQKEWEINMANQLEERAGVLIKTGNFGQAASDLEISLKMRTEKNDMLGVAMCYDKLGELYHMQGNFGEAVKNYDSALIIKEDFVEAFNKKHKLLTAAHWTMIARESIAETYLKLAQLYGANGLIGLSEEALNKSIATSRAIGSKKGEAEALTALGNLLLANNSADSAIVCYRQSKMIYAQLNSLPGLGISHENMGNYHSALDNPTAAMIDYCQAQQFFEQTQMLRDLPRVLERQAAIYHQNGMIDLAAEKYNAALSIAMQLDLKNILMKCHEALSEISLQNGNTGQALAHFREYARVKDAMFSIETSRQISEIETRYETQKKEQKILQLENENMLAKSIALRNKAILMAVAGFSIFAMLWLMLYVRHNRLRNQQEQNRLQQKLLRSQMNPHFIFNSLSSVQNAIINDRPDIAGSYLTRFSKLMRNILVSSTMEHIPLEDELATIENYLVLQKTRFSEKFDYFIQVDETVDTDQIQIPPMMLQPFIENAIEHGFKHLQTAGKIWVRFFTENEVLVIEVEDNGIGRQKAAELYHKDKRDYKSMATELTRQRIAALNRGKRRKITFNIIDQKNELGEAKGTKVVFRFPL